MWHKLTLPQNFLWKFHTCVWCVFIQCRHPCFLHNFPYLLKNFLFQIKAHKVQLVLPACAWVEGHLPKHGEFLRGFISEENNISLHRSPVFFSMKTSTTSSLLYVRGTRSYSVIQDFGLFLDNILPEAI